jgi:hypothetical protein
VSLWPDWPDGDRLHVWPATTLTPAELEHLRANKPAVLAYLRQRNADLLPNHATCEAWRRRHCNTGHQPTNEVQP